MRSDASERKKIIEREVAVADGVQAVPGYARKAEFVSNRVAIDGERISSKRARTHRARVRALPGMLQTRNIARKCLGMRQKEMRKQNWLGMLHVRHARHRHITIGFCLQQERIQHGFQCKVDLCGRIENKEAKIGRDQLVAAAAGMQFPAERPEFFDESFFNEVMHVLGCRAERFEPRGIRFGSLGNFVERRERLLHFRSSENADGLKRFRPRTIDRNLIRQETAIERKRALERVELSIWLTLEASSPQPVVFAFSHWSVLGRITVCCLRLSLSVAR